jgi:hypothetical protein
MKKSLYLLLSLAILCVIIFLTACTKDKTEQNPTAGLTKLTEGYVTGAGAKVEVYTKETSLTTGYTKFYLALYDSVTGKRIEEAHIHLTPTMNMGMMQHNAPFENPASTEAVDHLFPCSVTFIMSSMGGTWSLEIEVHNHTNDKEGSITIPLTIAEPAVSRQKSFTASHNGAKYFISLINPTAANSKVGINDMEIAIYKKESMMSWPADSSLSVILTPEMPTMGHGSPNNVNPVHVGKGHYKGKVNFTMTGLWRLNLDFMSGAAVADTTQFFDVQF